MTTPEYPNPPEGTFAQTPDQVAASAEASGGEFPLIPGYEITRKLGEGGMGVVYLATQRVLTAGDDGTARIWDARTGAQVLALKGHAGVVYCAAFSPDGSRLVTASDDVTARVWDVRTGGQLLALKAEADYWVLSAAFSPDGARVVTAGHDKTVRVWDAKTGTELLTLRGHIAAFNSDGTRVVTGTSNGAASVWDAKSGVELLAVRGHVGGIRSVAFSPDGARVLTAGGIVWRGCGTRTREPRFSPSGGTRILFRRPRSVPTEHTF